MPRPRRDLVVAAEELARRDHRLARVIEAVGPPDLRRGRPRRERFAALARMICYQQLAGAAARAIHGRFDALFDGAPTPDAVLAMRAQRLRAVGLSASKVASIRDLAAKVAAGDLSLDGLGRLDDEGVVRSLTVVRGIGRWTAEMFLMFQLGRLDVWPVGDYGVRKGFARWQGMAEMPTEAELGPLGDAYRPYRSIVAWYCWRVLDTVLPVATDPQG